MKRKSTTTTADPEDEQPAPEQAAQFSFRGKPLENYGFIRRCAIQRLGNISPEEYCMYLIRLLQMDDSAVDAIRGEEAVKAFRLESSKWAAREKVAHGKGLDEVITLAESIVAAANKG